MPQLRMWPAVGEYARMVAENASGDYDKIVFYDFDKTLVYTPGPTTGKRVWQEKTGTPWPYEGWWGRKESLDVSVFEMVPIKSVIARLNKDRGAGALTVLLTNRLPKLEAPIKRVLSSLHINLDEHTFFSASKAARVHAYAKAYPTVRVIDVYDDDIDHLVAINALTGRISAELRLFHVVDAVIHPVNP